MLFDTIGRKLLISIGIALCGISIALIPLFKQVYPYFLILRILISVGLIPAVNNPLLPDYVVVSSQGRGSAYMSILTSCGYIFSTSLLIQVSKSIALQYIFWFTSGFCIISAIIFMYGLKDVVKERRRRSTVK